MKKLNIMLEDELLPPGRTPFPVGETPPPSTMRLQEGKP